MPADLFRPRMHLPDKELAEAFNVPVREVVTRWRNSRSEPAAARVRAAASTRTQPAAGRVVRGRAAAIGRLKNEWSLTPLRVRLDRVRLHADLTILTKLACALSRARAVPLAA